MAKLLEEICRVNIFIALCHIVAFSGLLRAVKLPEALGAFLLDLVLLIETLLGFTLDIDQLTAQLRLDLLFDDS